MVKELGDFELLLRIFGGGFVVIEVQYYIGYLIKFRNSYRSLKRKEENVDDDSLNEMMNEFRVFVEFTIYVEKSVEEGKLLFKFFEFYFMYEVRLRDLGILK